MAQILRAYIKSRRSPSDAHHTKEKKSYAGNLLKQIRGCVPQTTEASDEAAAGMAVKILEQLTEQEKKVLELMAGAATNQEICDKLGISLPTVKRHTGNIYGKLGLKNRAQCLKLIRELGLP
jgi:LuxR family maltose regulon positive regulatory protein